MSRRAPTLAEKNAMSAADYKTWAEGSHPTFDQWPNSHGQVSPASVSSALSASLPGSSDRRLDYSIARGQRDALKRFQLENPTEAASVAADLAAAAATENALAIELGYRKPPAKFVAPTYKPAPAPGWFREMEVPEAYAHLPPEKQHAFMEMDKLVTAERDRVRDDQRANRGYVNWQPSDVENHLKQFAKDSWGRIPPYREASALERAPGGSLDPRVMTAEDVQSMSPAMRTAFMIARGLKEPELNLHGNPISSTGPFRQLSPAERDVSLSDVEPPIAAGSRVAISSVTAAQATAMAAADRRAFLAASEAAIRGGSQPKPIEGQSIEFVNVPPSSAPASTPAVGES